MRRSLVIAMTLSLMMVAPSARAGDDELVIAAVLCGVAAVATVGVGAGLAHWENGAAGDVRKASNRFRATPTQATARDVSAARERWQDAHDFNTEDDKFAWIVGLTGFVGISMCLGVGGGMLE